LFSLEDDIKSRIAIALDLELIGAEAARPPEHPDALDHILRARAVLSKPRTLGSLAESIGLFERALVLDPRSVEAQSRLAMVLTGRAMDSMTDSPAADIARAEDLAGQAVTASPRSPLAHLAKGQVLRAQAQVLGAQRRYEEAIPEYETALALDRNLVFAIAAVGRCKLMTGAIDEVIPLVEQAIRLSPRDPQIAPWFEWIGRAHLLQSRTGEAILWLEKACSANPEDPSYHAWLASACALNGESERAAAELADARRLSRAADRHRFGDPGVRPDDRFSGITRLREYLAVPQVRDLFEATYFAGLRKAGMPEE
jgi:tetratricopeptide (TPR) repeat protein